MDVKKYLAQTDDLILASIQSGDVPTGALLDDDCWQRICRVRLQQEDAVDSRDWRSLSEHRIEAFYEQPDEVILHAILQEAISSGFLLDADSWRRICQVRGRNISVVDRTTWIAICEQRGNAGG